MTLERFTLQDLPATPWKNGGGTTREIVCWPPGSGLEDFWWRASVATIDAPGPFSAFEGVDRTILLLEGAGVLLAGEGFSHWLDTPHQPFDFSGDTPVECSLIGGTTTDFNLMSRRAHGRAELRVLTDEPLDLPPAEHGLLLTLDGQYRIDAGYQLQGRGLWWAREPHAWRLVPASRGARLLVVQWWPVASEEAPDDFDV
jgi:environmental stress-induced protein Ves